MVSVGRGELIQVPLNYPTVSYNRTRLAVIGESYPQLRLSKWEDAVRCQQRIGKRSLLEMLPCRSASSNTIKEFKFLCWRKERMNGAGIEDLEKRQL